MVREENKMAETEWMNLNVTKHHTAEYGVSRLPNEAQDQMNSLLTAVALTDSYEFVVEDNGANEDFDYSWRNEKGGFMLSIKLNEDHKAVELLFSATLGGPIDITSVIRFSTIDDEMTALEVIEKALIYA
jgi:hypothetical protein